MESFSPLSAIIGGVLIGLSAAVLWIGNGRIAGVSGIFGTHRRAERPHPLAHRLSGRDHCRRCLWARCCFPG